MRVKVNLVGVNRALTSLRVLVWKILWELNMFVDNLTFGPALRKVSQYSGARVLLKRLYRCASCDDELHRAAVGYVSSISRSILDVGCGDALYLVSVGGSKIGLDIWRPSLQKARAFCSDTVQCDLKGGLPVKDKSFDTVLCIEVIEHLDKDQGLSLLQELSRVARREVILTTPRGFQPLTSATQPYMTHRSGWTESELQGLGYVILCTVSAPPCTIYRRELAQTETITVS